MDRPQNRMSQPGSSRTGSVVSCHKIKCSLWTVVFMRRRAALKFVLFYNTITVVNFVVLILEFSQFRSLEIF